MLQNMPAFLSLLLQGTGSQMLATPLRQALSQLTPFPNFRFSYYVASKKAQQDARPRENLVFSQKKKSHRNASIRNWSKTWV